MEPQAYEWTCSVCSFTWTLNATAIAPELNRPQALEVLTYPECVNEVYGCMSSDCMIEGYRQFDVEALQSWVTFDQAFAICNHYTGLINPQGMYHYMAIRGVQGDKLWVANSAPGYLGVWDTLSRSQFEAYGPVQIVALYERR